MKITKVSLLASITFGLTLITPHHSHANDLKDLKQALTFHASFDKTFDADFSTGDPVCRVRSKGKIEPATANEELVLLSEGGRFGGCLHFLKKGTTRPEFKGPNVLNYTPNHWSTSVSVWLKLDPNKDLEPGYCDPVQIIGNDTKKGFVFLEWSKNETPRFFRFAIRPLFHIWNPNGVQWDEIPFDNRPMVQVANAPFSRDQWTHVVFTISNINDQEQKPVGRLYINGKHQGSIENWDLKFDWDPQAVLLVLGASYVGQLDDLAVFNRSLTEQEIEQLYKLPTGVAELRP